MTISKRNKYPASRRFQQPIRTSWLGIWLIPTLMGLILLAALPEMDVNADSDRVLNLKTAYCYHYMGYTKWPTNHFENDSDPIVIGLLGINPIDVPLANLAQNKRVINQPLELRRFPDPNEYKTATGYNEEFIANISECDVLYLSATLDDLDWAPIARQAQEHAILTISESENYPVMIRHFQENDRIVFIVRLDLVTDAGLHLSSKLLKLGKEVITGGKP